MKKVNGNSNPIGSANSANSNNSVNENKIKKEEPTMIDINNIENLNPTILKVHATMNGMTADEISKAIENKTHTFFDKAGDEFIKFILENRYATKWLSFDDPIILHTVRWTLFDFNNAIMEYRGTRSGFEYEDTGDWWCLKIEEAIESVYNYTKHGDIAPFIGFCKCCWEKSVLMNIDEYEHIRKFFEEMKGENDMKEEINGKAYMATTRNGYDIYIGAETIEHLKAHSDVSIKHIQAAIKKNDTYNGTFEIKTIAFEGLPIGKDHCIEVEESDPDVHQLYRKGRAGTTPIAFSKEAPYTRKITIGICLDDDGVHTLFTAFYGQLAPMEPWDPSLPEKDRAESEAFWRTHAIVALPDEIDWERSNVKYLIDYLIEGPDGKMVRRVGCFKTETALFHFASELYAFDDCYDVEVHAIICDGISCKYTGWQRNMLFTYVNEENGEVVWECEYPEFDH